MVIIDIEFNNSLKGMKKTIDKKIENTGTIEELQEIANSIYAEQIESKIKRNSKGRETLKQKYGGYKTKTVKMQENKIRKSDWNRDK